jgi:hypothetical protein
LPEPTSEPSDRELRQISRDPDIKAQQNLSIASAISRMTADEQARQEDREMEIYYKAFDPEAHFINKADDLTRKPRQNDGQYREYQRQMAKMCTDKFIKDHPERGQGRIDRFSKPRKLRRRKVKSKPRRPVAKKSAKVPRWWSVIPGKKHPAKWTRRELSQALIIRNQFAVIEYLMEQSGIKWTTRRYEALIKKAAKIALKKEEA